MNQVSLTHNRVHINLMEKQLMSNQDGLPNERCYAHFCCSAKGQKLLFGTHGFWKAYGNSLGFHI